MQTVLCSWRGWQLGIRNEGRPQTQLSTFPARPFPREPTGPDPSPPARALQHRERLRAIPATPAGQLRPRSAAGDQREPPAAPQQLRFAPLLCLRLKKTGLRACTPTCCRDVLGCGSPGRGFGCRARRGWARGKSPRLPRRACSRGERQPGIATASYRDSLGAPSGAQPGAAAGRRPGRGSRHRGEGEDLPAGPALTLPVVPSPSTTSLSWWSGLSSSSESDMISTAPARQKRLRAAGRSWVQERGRNRGKSERGSHEADSNWRASTAIFLRRALRRYGPRGTKPATALTEGGKAVNSGRELQQQVQPMLRDTLTSAPTGSGDGSVPLSAARRRGSSPAVTPGAVTKQRGRGGGGARPGRPPEGRGRSVWGWARRQRRFAMATK